MKPIFINKEATITSGKLEGFYGRVVGANAQFNEVEIEIEAGCVVTISRDLVSQ